MFELLDTEKLYQKYKNYVPVYCNDINDEIDNDIEKNNDSLSSNNDNNDDDNDNDNDVFNNKINNFTYGNLPPKALLNGLYCGPVPEELKDLNFVEITMISINNPVTKIRVEGSYYYY